jgi:hypothetical protein
LLRTHCGGRIGQQINRRRASLRGLFETHTY